MILLIPILFVQDFASTVRLLTPQTKIHPKKGLADTQYKKDPTVGLDDHLSNCWNSDRLTKLHETDPRRRASYNEHFLTSNLWRLTELDMPRFFTVSGRKVRLILDEKRPSTISMSLWNDTFTYGSESKPFCLRVCADPPAVLPAPTRVLVGNFAVFSAFMWGHYGHSTHDSLPWFAYMKEMTAHDQSIKYILLDYGRAKEIIGTLDPYFAHHRVVWG